MTFKKTFKIGLIALASFLITNCNEEKKNNPKQEVKPEVVTPKVFKATIKLKTSVEDKFSLLMNNVKIDEFQKMNISAYEMIPTSTAMETLEVTFFEGIFSNLIILDLGNKAEKNVEISSVELTYGSNAILASNDQIKDYFRLNKFVSYDDENNIFVTKKINGQHFPRLILKPNIINKLKK